MLLIALSWNGANSSTVGQQEYRETEKVRAEQVHTWSSICEASIDVPDEVGLAVVESINVEGIPVAGVGAVSEFGIEEDGV